MIGALCSFCGDLVAMLTYPWRQLFWIAVHLYISVWSIVLNWFTEVATRTLRIVTAFRREKEVVISSFLDKWVQRVIRLYCCLTVTSSYYACSFFKDLSRSFLVFCKHYELVSELDYIHGIIYSCIIICCIVDNSSLLSYICNRRAVDNENCMSDFFKF